MLIRIRIWILCHFSIFHHYGIEHFRTFLAISQTVTGRIYETCELTDADKAMNPQYFWTDPVDIRIRIRINLEIQIRITDHFQLIFRPWWSLRFLSALVYYCTLFIQDCHD